MGILDKVNPSQPETCALPWCEECAGAYRIITVIVVFILFYYLFLKGSVGDGKIAVNDRMNYKVFDFPLLENCCSWWPISHFFMFFVLGVLFPDCGVLLVTLGVMWELFEEGMDKLSGRERQKIKTASGKVEYSQNWWAGSMKDVIMNTAGFAAGWFVAKKLGKKVCVDGLNANTSWCGAKRYCDKDRCVLCSNSAKNV